MSNNCDNNYLKNVDKTFHDMLNKLVNESDDLWRCLKYNDSEALGKAITEEDKYKLIDMKDEKNRRILLRPFNFDIVTEERSELRIYMSSFYGAGVNDYPLRYTFEIIIHNDLWILDNGKQRPIVMMQEILRVLNYKPIEGSASKLNTDNQFGNIVRFNDRFQGYTFTLNAYSS